ncbi:MAG TPA: hypothetical protein P5069_13620 [Candidatus Hydrogenedentes bacterium]|nr:hypothetical protein [Candidatus Hydrogenedentota bacterium]
MKNTANKQTPRWLEGLALDPKNPAHKATAERFCVACAKEDIPKDLTFYEVWSFVNDAMGVYEFSDALVSVVKGLHRIHRAVASGGRVERYPDDPEHPGVAKDLFCWVSHSRLRRKARRGSLPPDADFYVAGEPVDPTEIRALVKEEQARRR